MKLIVSTRQRPPPPSPSSSPIPPPSPPLSLNQRRAMRPASRDSQPAISVGGTCIYGRAGTRQTSQINQSQMRYITLPLVNQPSSVRRTSQ